MRGTLRRRTVPASDPGAQPHCRLTRDEGLLREADTDALFSALSLQREVPRGNEFVFNGDRDELWERVSVFVDEEALCCPFFSFEQRETDTGVALSVLGEALDSR